MVFHRQQKRVKELNIIINDTNIESVQTFNFLEITLSENMFWTNHLLSIKKKISKVIGIYPLLFEKYISVGCIKNPTCIYASCVIINK